MLFSASFAVLTQAIDVNLNFISDSIDPARPNSYCTEVGSGWELMTSWNLDPDEYLVDNITFQYFENGAYFDMASLPLAPQIIKYNKYINRDIRVYYMTPASDGQNKAGLVFHQYDAIGNTRDDDADGTQFSVIFYTAYVNFQNAVVNRAKRNAGGTAATMETTEIEMDGTTTEMDDATTEDTSGVLTTENDVDASSVGSSVIAQETGTTEMATGQETATTGNGIATTDSATTDSATADSATTDSATTDSATTDSETPDSATTESATDVSEETSTAQPAMDEQSTTDGNEPAASAEAQATNAAIADSDTTAAGQPDLLITDIPTSSGYWADGGGDSDSVTTGVVSQTIVFRHGTDISLREAVGKL